MIRQIDDERNVVLVLTPREALSLNTLTGLALAGVELGVRGWTERDILDLELFQTALFQLTDEEITAATMAALPGQSREDTRERISRARTRAIAYGHFVSRD